MYYTPAIDRMKSIEVLKGSGSILYGPQTVGGVINYITNDPPLDPTFTISLRGGDGNYFTGQADYGTTVDNVGFQRGYTKQADKLELQDLI
jgi:Fe(3+) dicitrate transport protein